MGFGAPDTYRTALYTPFTPSLFCGFVECVRHIWAGAVCGLLTVLMLPQEQLLSIHPVRKATIYG